MTYHRRTLGYATQERALEACQTCRDGCVAVLAEAPITSPAYVAAQGVLQAIDGLAGILTGDPRFFHLKLHSTGPGMPERDGTE